MTILVALVPKFLLVDSDALGIDGLVTVFHVVFPEAIVAFHVTG